MTDRRNVSIMRQRLRRRRLIVGVAAAAASLALHFFLIFRLPLSFFFNGDHARPDVKASDYMPFDVVVRHEEWQSDIASMDELRLRFSDRQPRDLDVEIRSTLPLETTDAGAGMRHEVGSLPEDFIFAPHHYLAPAPAVDVGPGQEVLEITKRLVTDVDNKYRRLLKPSLERVRDAPDVLIPGIEEEIRRRAEETAAELAPDQVNGHQAAGLILPLIDNGRLQTAPLSDGGLAADDLLSGRIGESAAEITSVGALDPFLAARARQYACPVDGKHVYVALEISRRDSDGEFLEVLPKDVVFIQDLSGSMGARRIDACRRGIGKAMGRLSGIDRFNIVTFTHEIVPYADSWVPATLAQHESTRTFLGNMESRGMTDFNAALRYVSGMERDPDRSFLAVLLTDGLPPNVGETNTTHIIEKFTSNNRGAISVFAVSTGWWDYAGETYLLDMLTYRNRGEARIAQNDRPGVPSMIEELMDEIARPVLNALDYRFARDSRAEAYPVRLQNLYLDRPLVLYVRIPRENRKTVFQVTGTSAGRRYDFTFALPMEEVQGGGEEIRAQWARHRMYHLISRHMRSGDGKTLSALFETSENYGIEIPYLEEFTLPGRFRRRLR